MKKNPKLIALGAIVGVMALVFVYMMFFTGTNPEVPKEVLTEASKAAEEAKATEVPPPPPPKDRRAEVRLK